MLSVNVETVYYVGMVSICVMLTMRLNLKL